MRSDGILVGVVPLPFLHVGDEGEADHGDGAADPSQLRHAPREREHAAADHAGDDVREARP